MSTKEILIIDGDEEPLNTHNVWSDSDSDCESPRIRVKTDKNNNIK